MEVIDLSRMEPGSFTLLNAMYNFTNVNSMNPKSHLIFKECNINIIDNNITEDICKKIEFSECSITMPSLTINIGKEYYWNLINCILQNKIICGKLIINTDDINSITREELQAIISINFNRCTWKIGNKNRKKCTTPYFPIIQRMSNDLYLNNVLFHQGKIVNNGNLYLIGCLGELSTNNQIGVKGVTPRLQVSDGSTIYCKDIESLDISCDKGDSFNLFMSDPKEFKKVKYRGIIDNTNCEVMSYHQSRYKFRTFFNVDFSHNDMIQEFFNCRFYNCYFNENQLVVNSMLKSCEINGNNKNFSQCTMV